MSSIASYINSYSSILIFELSDEEFCIQISELKGILNSTEKDYLIKNSSEKLYIGFKNNLYPILDLTALLKLKKKKFEKDSRILLIENSSGNAAIRVNKVNEIINIDKNIIENLIKPDHSYIRGKLNYQSNTYLLLDFEEILLKTIKKSAAL